MSNRLIHLLLKFEYNNHLSVIKTSRQFSALGHGFFKNKSFLSINRNATNSSDSNDLLPTEATAKWTKPTKPTFVTSTTTMATIATQAPDITEWRLLEIFKPLEYDLTLRPKLQYGTFTGKVIIKFEVTEKSAVVQLHKKGLKLDNINLNNNIPTTLTEKQDKEMIIIKINSNEKELLPGVEHTLAIDFSGVMKNKIVGLYRSSYADAHGKTRYIATTQFEPTYARQAFPCFDEPNYKAKYTIHVEKPSQDNYIALSNMDVNNIKQLDEIEVFTFNTSVPMSTYITCIIVCDFIYKESHINPEIGKAIKLRIYATPAQVEKTAFALEVAANVTEYFVKYFGIEYPLPKLDMIAIPDFEAGAMENWGLVTYREASLLFDEKSSNVRNKQRVATVVAHELAHMWFGNLVTLNWWNDLWLNEGFARYMQYKAVDKILNDWGMMDQFLIEQVHPAMDFDATLASHPIVQTVATPNQISEMFDSISYNKGAAVLRMLENAIGEESFQIGIHKYLDKYKYGNAVTKNLWDELQAAGTEINIQDMMDTWTVQMGYPIVDVKIEGKKYILTQKRFLTNPESDPQSPPSIFQYKYTIPITYVTNYTARIETKLWFDKKDSQVSIDIPEITEWLKINYKGSGYYRVNYAPNLWRTLTKNIQELEISDRASLLDDAFALAKAGVLEYKIALDLSNTMGAEQDYVPWSVAARRLKELKVLLKSNVEIYQKFQKHVYNIVKPLYDEMSWTEEKKAPHQYHLLRSEVLDLACSFEMPKCLEETKKYLDGWLQSDYNEIPANLKAIVYDYGMEDISSKDWHNIREKYIKETDAQEKMRILNGLASTKNMKLLEELLLLAEDKNVIRSQDYFTCLKYISANSAGTELVWNYVRHDWKKLVERFTINDRHLGQLIPAITSSFTTDLKLKEIEYFFQKYPEAGAGEISRKTTLENVKNNIKWVENYQTKVKEWLDIFVH